LIPLFLSNHLIPPETHKTPMSASPLFYKFSNYQFMAAFSFMNRSRTNHSDAIIWPAPFAIANGTAEICPSFSDGYRVQSL